ncbi:MAG: DNA cytosine methyltransferase [Segniliparus sp.]|uniref:DNA cytosine methyltransferase n=1 Tax=Segniliparus sp. TaxID=2804064 RepID=UPI003F3A8402
MSGFYEFFAGGGMARAGLGPGWDCLFANDIDPKKAASYAANWTGEQFRTADISTLAAADLPGRAELAWASFPCQDLSLAGAGAGLGGERSGTFWSFWGLVKKLKAEGRAPRIVVLENVVGLLSSHAGGDFAAVCSAIASAGYSIGALVADAARFTPQSRPRLFVIAVSKSAPVPRGLVAGEPDPAWHPRGLVRAHARLPENIRRAWNWWALPEPAPRRHVLADLVEAEPTSVQWHAPEQTARLLDTMSPINLAKVEAAKHAACRSVGTVYRRTRAGSGGEKAVRAEARFDGLAGCLRTPAGGSSRQVLLVVEGGEVRSRLLSPREAARLMGLPDSYLLPERANDAYHLLGDGVVVPVVRFLAEHLVEPLADSRAGGAKRTA